jgi:Protein of unknown function (DUF3631)
VKNGKPLSAIQLARLLRHFKIRPRTIRQDDDTAKGYTLEDCEPKFRRYLQKTQFEPSHPSQINQNNDLEQNFEPSQPVTLPSDPPQTDRFQMLRVKKM